MTIGFNYQTGKCASASVPLSTLDALEKHSGTNFFYSIEGNTVLDIEEIRSLNSDSAEDGDPCLECLNTLKEAGFTDEELESLSLLRLWLN